MIIKSYRKKDSDGYFGQDIQSWSSRWTFEDIAYGARIGDKDYLSYFFRRYFPKPPQKIIEGGCGSGKYVTAYRRLGYDIVGVDFSKDLVERLNQFDNSLPVYEGNVKSLPFKDGSFECYFSGGVFEHFEEGPSTVIKEARRILKKGGILLATVPYISILRKILCQAHPVLLSEQNRILQIRANNCEMDKPPEDYNFCEYLFDVMALTPYFEENGFLINRTYPISFLWGVLGGVPRNCIRKYLKKNEGKGSDKTAKEQNASVRSHAAENKRSFIENMAYDFLISENRDNIFYRLPLMALNKLAGAMVLFVAEAI